VRREVGAPPVEGVVIHEYDDVDPWGPPSWPSLGEAVHRPSRRSCSPAPDTLMAVPSETGLPRGNHLISSSDPHDDPQPVLRDFLGRNGLPVRPESLRGRMRLPLHVGLRASFGVWARRAAAFRARQT